MMKIVRNVMDSKNPEQTVPAMERGPFEAEAEILDQGHRKITVTLRGHDLVLKAKGLKRCYVLPYAGLYMRAAVDEANAAKRAKKKGSQ